MSRNEQLGSECSRLETGLTVSGEIRRQNARDVILQAHDHYRTHQEAAN
jgi:F0F1-type ATP synthase beta subunit